MYVCNSEIVQKANRIVAQCGTRDPKRIARELGIEVMYLPFSKQRGASISLCPKKQTVYVSTTFFSQLKHPPYLNYLVRWVFFK